MRRANKILMASVAILLCLVLITTSVVSGVFAKFAIKKQASTSVSFQKFGVTVKMSKNPKYTNVTETTINTTGESGTIGFDLPLNCGSDYSELLKIKFEGIPTVKVKVSLIFHANFSYWNSSAIVKSFDFSVAANAASNVTSNTHFMPLGFKFGANYVDENNNSVTRINSKYIIDPWVHDVVARNATNYGDIRTRVEKQLGNGIDANVSGFTTTEQKFKMDNSQLNNGSDYGIYGFFDPNDSTTGADVKANGVHFHTKDENEAIVNEFVLGFDWPLDWTDDKTDYDYDELATYFAQNADGKPVVFWFTVKIEQV